MNAVFILLFSLALANDLASSSKNLEQVKNTNSAAIELENCKPQVDKATNSEEVFARKAAEKNDLSKYEILARLIYSESLSSGYWKGTCNAHSGEDIMQAIGWGAMNRIKTKLATSLNAYTDVVFAKMQFRTSFSSKKENPFAQAFLCPLKSQKYLNEITGKNTAKITAEKLFKTAQETAQKIIDSYEKNGIPAEYKGVTNFFYPESEFFGEMRPAWAKNPEAAKNKGYVNILNVAQKPCVEYYRLK